MTNIEERTAELMAHRACGNQEQDIQNGKLAGYCVVCQDPWPCSYALPKGETLELSQAAIVKTSRELELEELLRSACAIAERNGEGTHWGRFINSINKAGLSGVTPRTYRLLPSDPVPSGRKIRTQEDRDDDKFDAEMS